jgi:hypothetical protein
LKNGSRGKNPFLLPLVFLLFLSPAGCFYDLNLEAPPPLNINPGEYQPAVFFPIPDASGHPESGAVLYAFIRSFLEEKGYVLIKEDAVLKVLEDMKLTTLLLLSDPDALVKIAELLNARLLIIGTIPEYTVQRSSWGTETFPVDRDGGDYLSLPAYHQGKSQIRLVLRFFESGSGSLLWVAEGGIRAPSSNAEEYGKRLAARLLRDLPPIRRPTKE